MRNPASRETTNKRMGETLREMRRVEKLARTAPGRAIREVDILEDPQIRVSVLIAIAKHTGLIETLTQARETLLGIPDVANMTKSNRLAKIAFAAVGVDNEFAAETASEVTGKVMSTQLHQQLSVGITGSLKTKLSEDDCTEFNRYPDLVVASFYESVGDSSYFGDAPANFQYITAPTSLTKGKQLGTLDPFLDGLKTMAAFRHNEKYYNLMADFTNQQR